ncbi:phage tail protein [Undibacterium sp. SXout7W]|uniref:phage tail protein n=1 Tax=Undibacterium sp. SXout7W TaxID=3413049 RepID=UPI003BF20F4F
MMMSLGQFVFSLSTVAYQDFQRQSEWKHPNTSRVGERDAHQYIGPGDDTITLSGWMAPAFAGDPASFNDLREMADAGDAYVLVEGTGRIYGQFVVTHLTEGKSIFLEDGLPLRIEFSLSLKRVDLGDQINLQPDQQDNDIIDWEDIDLE